MDRASNDLAAALTRRLSAAASQAMPGIVTAVDENERTATVAIDGLPYKDVRLHAVSDGRLKGFCFIPKVGSGVMVGRIGGSNELYVAMSSEVDRMFLTIAEKQSVEITDKLLEIKTDKSNLKITPAGFTLIRDGAGLKKTLADLCDAINRLTVTTSSGPSGLPINAAEFSAIKQELNKYLEG